VELSSDFKELVRSRTEIVGLIQDYLTLIPVRGGREFKGLCPFHDDKNPSLIVYPERQSYKCWSCQAGGDVFTFVQEIDGLSFPEALKRLAERVHLEMPEQSPRQAQDAAKKTELYSVLKWAELLFHDVYLKSAEAEDARRYIREARGYSSEIETQFHLGYHPDDWEWIQKKAKSQFSTRALEQSQLISKRDEGKSGYFDYFVDRVLFPIHDERKRTVAFGGRLIPGHKERPGKYFNSKESPVFQKNRILFGLPHALPAIREQKSDEKTVLVVEGYADCVACHQFGVRNVVAGMGTALTEFQCSRLKAFAQRIVLVYDGDQPGQDAAARAVGSLIGQSVDLRVLTMPEGQDPDEFLKANGSEVFQQMIDAAPEAWEFRLNYEVKKHGTDSVNGREQVLNQMIGLLAGVPDLTGTPREAVILGRLASRLQLAEGVIRQQISRSRGNSKPSSFPMQSQPAPVEEMAEVPVRRIDFHRQPLSKGDKLECELLEILFTQPELSERIRQEVGEADFQNPHLRELLQFVYDVIELGELPTFQRVTLEIERAELKSLAVWIEDQARLKGVEAKLRDFDDGPGLLRQVLAGLKWRREEMSHQAEVNRQAMAGQNVQDDVRARLMKAHAFHRRRATDR